MKKISRAFLITSVIFLATCDAGHDFDFNIATKKTDNNSLGTAQLVANPVTLAGYVSMAGVGEQGSLTRYSNADDIFRINALGGEVVNLTMPESYPADVDLYLYDSSGNLVDYSLGVTRFESIKLPAIAGIYYVSIRIFDVSASSYQLTIGVDSEPVTATQSVIRTAAESDFVIGDVIVKYESSESDDIGDLLQGASFSTSWESGPIPYQFGENIADYSSSLAINHPNSELELKAATWRKIKAIAKSSGVEYAEPNFIHQHMTTTVNDPLEPWHYANINFSAAKDIAITDNDSVKVAVIDTGIYQQHPDLNGFISDLSLIHISEPTRPY